MFQKFIERPVLSTVISILLVIVGILGLTKLPLQQFPDIAPPAVLVACGISRRQCRNRIAFGSTITGRIH